MFLRTTGVTSLTGEAYVNRRKAKIIAGYEMELKIAYEGEIKVDGEVVGTSSGTVHFPYIADENAGDQPEAKVLAGGGATQRFLYARARHVMGPYCTRARHVIGPLCTGARHVVSLDDVASHH